MKNYRYYKAIDFAQDKDFIRWVKSGETDAKLHEQWITLLTQNHELCDTIDEARTIVKGVLNEEPIVISDQKRQQLWQRIDALTPEDKVRRLSIVKPKYISIAAAVVLFATVCSYLLFFTQSDSIVKQNANYSSLTKDLVRFKNDSEKPSIVVLKDGSKVTLMPNSMLSYPETFSDNQRKVYLSGEAFFEITKNPRKPFLVFANELVTQVLGTSFTVRAYDQERKISVVVRTGKVSVYPSSKPQEVEKDKFKGTLLLPNQQIVYSRDQARVVKSLIDAPVIIPTISKVDFQFNDTPIGEVFVKLEKAYGVNIVYDEDEMKSCFLNASLDDLDFYDKLRLICKGINAKYEVLDAHIIITSGGCQ